MWNFTKHRFQRIYDFQRKVHPPNSKENIWKDVIQVKLLLTRTIMLPKESYDPSRNSLTIEKEIYPKLWQITIFWGILQIIWPTELMMVTSKVTDFSRNDALKHKTVPIALGSNFHWSYFKCVLFTRYNERCDTKCFQTTEPKSFHHTRKMQKSLES